MTRQTDIAIEERERLRTDALVRAVEFELSGSIANIGGALRGISITFDEWAVKLVVKASFEGKPMVSYIEAETLKGGLIKCVSLAYNNRIRWRHDKYGEVEA